MNNKWFLILFSQRLMSLWLSTLMVAGCDESLPPREDPRNYFVSSLDTFYDPNRNNLIFYLRMYNNYDETIEDDADIKGTLEIEWVIPDERRPPINIKRTVSLTQDNIQFAKGFDRVRQRLTINPKDTISLYFFWDFKTDDGTYLYRYFAARQDYSCLVAYPGGVIGYRRITEVLKFKVSAKLQLTKRTSIIYFDDIVVEHCFVVPYRELDTRNPCPPPPCN